MSKVIRRFPNITAIVVGLLGGLMVAAVPAAYAQFVTNAAFGTANKIRTGSTTLSVSSIADTELLYRTGTTVDGLAQTTFFKMAGIATGQAPVCGTASGDDCTFSTTSHGTKGNFYIGGATGFNYDEANGRLGIGVAPTLPLDITKAGEVVALIKSTDNNALVRLDRFAAGAYSGFQFRTAASPTWSVQSRAGSEDLVVYDESVGTVTKWKFGNSTGRFEVTGVLGMMSSFIERYTTAGLTASTTQTQAAGTAINGEVAQLATVANANDAYTLGFGAVAGRCIRLMNTGANTAQIFPAVGASDNFLGAAADAAVTLAANKSRTYCAYDSTVWFDMGGN